MKREICVLPLSTRHQMHVFDVAAHPIEQVFHMTLDTARLFIQKSPESENPQHIRGIG